MSFTRHSLLSLSRNRETESITGRSFRDMDIENAEEFVPAHLRDQPDQQYHYNTSGPQNNRVQVGRLATEALVDVRGSNTMALRMNGFHRPETYDNGRLSRYFEPQQQASPFPSSVFPPQQSLSANTIRGNPTNVVESRDQPGSQMLQEVRARHPAPFGSVPIVPRPITYPRAPLMPQPHIYRHNQNLDLVNGHATHYRDVDSINQFGSKASTRSATLQAYLAYHKSSDFQLKDILGYVVEFSGDQSGSRFIQTKLEKASSEEKDKIFSELEPEARSLMTDVFGNYVIQKVFDHGTQTQKKILAGHMKGYVVELSLQAYGCRCVQRALDHVLREQQIALIKELEGSVLAVVENQHGNHVIQKAISCVPPRHMQFIVDAHRHHVVRMSRHVYGCRIMQRMLETCSAQVKQPLLDELHHAVPTLIEDQYGNYVIQCMIETCTGPDQDRVIDIVKRNIFHYSKHKFASNVVEKALTYAEPDQRVDMVERLTSAIGHNSIPFLLRDQFGNYVIQTALKTLRAPEQTRLAFEVGDHLLSIGNVHHGKQILKLTNIVATIIARSSPISASTNPETPRTPTNVESMHHVSIQSPQPIGIEQSSYQQPDALRSKFPFNHPQSRP